MRGAPRAFAVACRTLLTEPVSARPAVPVDVHPEARRLRLVR
jgi:hypothetical protein